MQAALPPHALFRSSHDGSSENLLILLHGLGDTPGAWPPHHPWPLLQADSASAAVHSPRPRPCLWAATLTSMITRMDLHPSFFNAAQYYIRLVQLVVEACNRAWSCRREDTPDSSAARRKHLCAVRSAFCKAGGPDGAATDGDPGVARRTAGGGHQWRARLVRGLRRARGGPGGEAALLRDWVALPQKRWLTALSCKCISSIRAASGGPLASEPGCRH